MRTVVDPEDSECITTVVTSSHRRTVNSLAVDSGRGYAEAETLIITTYFRIPITLELQLSPLAAQETPLASSFASGQIAALVGPNLQYLGDKLTA